MKKAWTKAVEAVDVVVDRVATIPGVASIHGQLADTLAVVVVLVDSDDAKAAVRKAESELFDESPALPVDLHVHRLSRKEIPLHQKALDSAYGLLWSNK